MDITYTNLLEDKPIAMINSIINEISKKFKFGNKLK